MSCCKESLEGTHEEETLEESSKNRHRGCGCDMLGKNVPSMGSSNRETNDILFLQNDEKILHALFQNYTTLH